MQTTSIASLSVTPGGVDAAADTAGQGARVNAASGKKTRESLFTEILQQGITDSGAAGHSGETLSMDNAEENGEKNDGDSADVCSLLLQLAAQGVPGQSPADAVTVGTDDGAPGSIQDIVTVYAGSGTLEEIALHGEDQAAILHNGTAAGETGTVDGGGQASDSAAAQSGTAFASIKAALQNEAAQAAQAANRGGAPETSGPGAAALENGATAVTTDADAVRTEESAAGDRAAGGFGGMSEGRDMTAAGISSSTSTDSGGASGDMERSPDDRSGLEAAAAAGSGAASAAAGTAAGGETAAEKAAAVEKALNRFGDDLRSLRGGTHEIKIVLEPESLGVLTITVSKTEMGISAKIKAEDKEVVAAITDQLHKLISSMESKGIRLDDVDVVQSQPDMNAGFEQRQSPQNGNPSPRGRASPSGDSNQDDAQQSGAFWQGFNDNGRTGDSMVEYRI